MNFRIKSDKLQKKIVTHGVVKKFGDAELSYSCGYPVIKLHGSYYRMGLQYGVLMSGEIRGLYSRNNGRKAEVMNALPWYLRPAGGFIVLLVAGYSFLRIPRKYRRELSAISRGSGVAFIDIASTAFGGVVFDAACTSVLARGERGIIHAQNLDFEPAYLGEFPAIVEYNHPGKLRYMHLGIAGIPGIFHGMNEKGISVTVNYGDGTYNSANKGLPMGYKLREVLERAGCLDDVERIFRKKGPDELGWIITVSSASENTGAVFDIFNNEIIRRDFTGGKPEFMLNDIFSPSRLGDTLLSKKYLQVSRGEGIYNLARESRIKKYIEERNIASADDMIDFLRDYDFYGYKKFCGSMNATIVNERTLHTIIFNHAESAVYLSSAEGYSALAPIVKYDFNTGALISHSEAAPEFDSVEMRGFLDWYCSYQDAALISTVTEGISRRFKFVKFREHDFSPVVKSCPAGACRNPRELWSLFRIWKKGGVTMNPEDLLASCRSMTERYPDFAILYIIKGNIEKSLKRREEAINTFEQALGCGIISGYDRIHILNDLVYLCRKNGLTGKAVNYAEQNVKLIEMLSEKYTPVSRTEKIYFKMKKFMQSQI